jgi:hypothetical protein
VRSWWWLTLLPGLRGYTTEKTVHAVEAILHGRKLTERFPTGQ